MRSAQIKADFIKRASLSAPSNEVFNLSLRPGFVASTSNVTSVTPLKGDAELPQAHHQFGDGERG